MASIRTKDNGEISDFKVVPGCLAEITLDWCDKVLKNELILSTDTFVSSINIIPLQNETSGLSDGGGFSGSTDSATSVGLRCFQPPCVCGVRPKPGTCFRLPYFLHYIIFTEGEFPTPSISSTWAGLDYYNLLDLHIPLV